MTQSEEFEEWALKNCYILRLDGNGDYEKGITFSAYEAWQAAKAQAVPELSKEILKSLRDMVEIVGSNFCSNQDVKRKYKIARDLLEQNK